MPLSLTPKNCLILPRPYSLNKLLSGPLRDAILYLFDVKNVGDRLFVESFDEALLSC